MSDTSDTKVKDHIEEEDHENVAHLDRNINPRFALTKFISGIF